MIVILLTPTQARAFEASREDLEIHGATLTFPPSMYRAGVQGQCVEALLDVTGVPERERHLIAAIITKIGQHATEAEGQNV